MLINDPDREYREEGIVVRAKKQTRRAGSINYLLSLDRTLRRASVRKLVDRVKPKRRTSAKAASKPMKVSAKRTSRTQRRSTLAPRNVVVGTLCVVAAAAIVMGRPSSRAWVTHLDEKGQVTSVEPLVSADQIAAEPAAERPAPRVVTESVFRTPAAPPALTEKPVRPLSAEPARLPNAVYTAEPATPPATAASVRSSENGGETAVATTKEGSAVAASVAEPVTITGCLERNDDTYSLKNATGDGAPTARSWKSGFLRKRTASVTVTGAYTTRLASYVGRRVETTGILVDREMQAKSVRVLGSCE